MLDYADWGVLILNIYSYYLIGNRNKHGFALGLVGCVLSIILFSTIMWSVPLIVMNICFGILNTRNYLKWT